MSNYNFGNDARDHGVKEIKEIPGGTEYDIVYEEAPEEPRETKTKSTYDLFKAAMNKPVIEESTKAYVVEGRDEISVVYSLDLEYEILKRMIARHTNKKKEVDPLNLAFDLIPFLCRGFRVNGEDVLTEKGEPIVISSPDFLGFCNAESIRDAIRWLYSKDARIIAVANSLIADAGYGDMEVEEDGDFRSQSR